MSLDRRIDNLANILKDIGGVLVAYSGGADSAFLAEMSHRTLGPMSLAVTADSPSIPREELRQAVALANKRGWRHKVIETLEMDDERYTSNPSNRCFFCKSALMDRLAPMAESEGLKVILGTNIDDLSDHRPGQASAAERGALSPMVTAGLTKADVRESSRSMSLTTWDKPAAACLSSRIAYGVRVTAPALGRIEAAEKYLHEEGFAVVRVRDLGGDVARVEVSTDATDRLIAMSDDVREYLLTLGFLEVNIHKDGYKKGAMNELVGLRRPSS